MIGEHFPALARNQLFEATRAPRAAWSEAT